MHKFRIIERIRKKSPSPESNIRLHRSEFGDGLRKNYNINSYYPDTTELINKISKFYKINKELVSVGLGAEGLIKDVFLTFHLKKIKTKILTTSPNFFMYNYYAKLFGFRYKEIEVLKKNKKLIDCKQLISSLKKGGNNFLILINPSSPIEKKWSYDNLIKILNFCKKKKIFILLDNVYNHNINFPYSKLIKKFKNLIILNSFSKIYGLPGLRLGFCFSNKMVIKEINTCRLAIELPANTIDYSRKILTNRKELNKKIYKIRSAFKFAKEKFKNRGIQSLNNDINSITFFCKNENEKKKLIKFMEKKNILINSVKSKFHKNLINITTTNKENLKIFFKQLDNFLKN
jgi:histidinol-phosphate/aromatic aminotransferase/cobyric acid decarboxylase-like protein